jgi:hypothetical protein
MKRTVIAIVLGGLSLMGSASAQVSPTTPKAARIRIIQGPEPESANEYLTIIRWTTNNPGGSPVHYGIVHYGMDPKSLDQTAKNPIRLNPGHDTTIFRVRIEGLKLGKTYYYTVESEEANGTNDGVKSAVKQFKVGPIPRPEGR